VVLRAYTDRKFEGKITWISEVLDEKTRTLKVRVELDNRERLLKPGSFAHVFLKTVIKQNGVAVPPSAVQRQKSEFIVFVASGDGVYKRREVKVGARSKDAVELVDGIETGEVVVTDGSFVLKSELEKSAFADND
jgi:cobalt-zinc-cadmium efflux system membrane fusion protein